MDALCTRRKKYLLETLKFVRVEVGFDDIRIGGKKICTLGHLRWKQIFLTDFEFALVLRTN
jgi:hypothetical protein